MPFSLRNARATYQHLVDKAFHNQIGRNLEVYVDDLVITKPYRKLKALETIEETFKTQSGNNHEAESNKHTFGGRRRNVPRDVHKLKGKMESLNSNLAKSVEKSLPFFKTLKKCTKKSDIHWTEEFESAFKQMKQLIAELSTLTAPDCLPGSSKRSHKFEATNNEAEYEALIAGLRISRGDGCKKPPGKCGFQISG
ncbi:hypothetical protein Tco_1051805 [Tanacetum coccineum]